MAFSNDKKTFLSKLDKSKKGGIDIRAVPFLDAVNSCSDLYSTSSCSGRVYLWQGSGKKNEMEWVRMSHDPIESSFFRLSSEELKEGNEQFKKKINESRFLKSQSNKNEGTKKEGRGEKKERGEIERVVWMRFESSIFHVCCESIDRAKSLLKLAQMHYKKSSILSINKKIMVEIRGGDVIEMPLYIEGKLVFSGDVEWLTSLVNKKMDLMWLKMEKCRVALLAQK